jgi:5-formyltetrahydrofolate cyclo-ligase
MMIDINLQKKKQRTLSVKKRFILNKFYSPNNLSFNEILQKIDWFNNSIVVASFISIKSEISTISLNKFIWKSGKILCLPVMADDKEGLLSFSQHNKEDSLVVGKFGVKEPIHTKSHLPDIIFVPCLAYDKFGFRLGYGGGYYDKTIFHLYSIKHNFITVGLAYEDQRVDKVIHDHLDQKLNYILTEKQLYKIL